MKKKRMLPALLLALSVLLSGCTTEVLNRSSSVTLSPVRVPYSAPVGDSRLSRTETVVLYVPDETGTRLITVSEKVQTSSLRHPVDETLQMLLSYAGGENSAPISPQTPLQTLGPVEISGNTAVVNLGTSALWLDGGQLYRVCRAITNTLCQWGDIRFVSVLINSRQMGLDMAASVPAGCFATDTHLSAEAMKSDLQSLISGGNDRTLACLYYPIRGGRGVAVETKQIEFERHDKASMVASLLNALSKDAETLQTASVLPNLLDCLIPDGIAVQENAATGGQVAVLHFDDAFNTVILDSGVPRSVMMASLALTVLTFVPGLSGLMVYAGEELITEVTPGSTYRDAGRTVAFENGVMHRKDFDSFLLSECPLCLATENGKLKRITRALPYRETCSPRALVNCLFDGPQMQDSAPAGAVFPQGLADSDLLGTGLEDGVLLLNFSARFGTLCAGLSAENEKQLVYSLVNTLTEAETVRSVCIFIDGVQPETLSGSLHLPGTFMKNTGIVN